ncbi:MAG: hypothetical protein ACKO6A_06880 [Bacteroidota bacterium]
MIFQPSIWKNKKHLFCALSFTILPLLTFFILSKWSNSISDRTTEPFGFFEYQSHWKSVFLSPNGIFGVWISRFISFENLNWEGTSYIGFTSVIVLFSLILLRIITFFRPISNELFPKELRFYLVSSSILLTYLFGGEKKKHEYEIDNVLIKPLELNVVWKNDLGVKHLNSFQL